MKRQLQGIGLLLFGVQTAIFALIDPWIPLIGDPGRVALPILSVCCGVAGLVLCFKGKTE